MKKIKIILVLLIAVFAMGNIFATDELVSVNFLDSDLEDSIYEVFYIGFNAILQGKCQGAVLAFGPEAEYIAGHLGYMTPEDFCVKIPKSTLAAPVKMPREIAALLFSYLGDRTAYASVVASKYEILEVLVLYLPVKNMVLEATPYAWARIILENSVKAHGLEIEDFYAVMERNGHSQESLVMTLKDGETKPSQIVEDAMRMLKKEKEKASIWTTIMPILVDIALALVGALILFSSILLLKSIKTSKQKKHEMEIYREEKNNSEEEFR